MTTALLWDERFFWYDFGDYRSLMGHPLLQPGGTVLQEAVLRWPAHPPRQQDEHRPGDQGQYGPAHALHGHKARAKVRRGNTAREHWGPQPLSASAPPTISRISPVMAAWRALL